MYVSERVSECVWLCVCLSACLSACFSGRVSNRKCLTASERVCLSVWLSVCLSACVWACVSERVTENTRVWACMWISVRARVYLHACLNMYSMCLPFCLSPPVFLPACTCALCIVGMHASTLSYPSEHPSLSLALALSLSLIHEVIQSSTRATQHFKKMWICIFWYNSAKSENCKIYINFYRCH